MRTLLAEAGADDIEVLVPRDTHLRPEEVAALGSAPVITAIGNGRGHRWEQCALPSFRPDAWLLSLCNMGPIARQRQALVIHDAQVVLHPESYSRSFRWWYRVAQTVASRRADAVFTVSHFSKAALERHNMVPRGKTHVLRSGVDHLTALGQDDAALSRNALQPGGYLLAIGSLARHKNLPMLVDAFVDADLPDVSLVVAGGGYGRVFQAAGLRQAPNIHYIGRVTDRELKALYEGALAFACPSLSEGFGLTPLEAMTVGCPVVATTGGAVPEICGDAALYADPRDRGAWRDALRAMTIDATLRATYTARALARSRLFSWREAARQMLIVLAELGGDRDLLAYLRADAERGLQSP